MDPLAEVLRSVRLTGGVFLEMHLTAPWCFTSKVTAEDCRPFLAVPAQVIGYHVIIGGRFLLNVDGMPPLEVYGGEAILLPRNDLHTLASAPGLEPTSADDLIQPSPSGGLARVVHGGGGEATHLVCGFLASEEAYNPLIATLPKALKLDFRESASREWVEASVRFAAKELMEGRFASSDVLSRLSELLLVEAVRKYALTLDDEKGGWLKGLRDSHVGRALTLMHHDLSTHWSADALAREVGLSRSAFSDRFMTLVGMPPIRYLSFWRLQSGKLQLRETTKTISQIAHSVGYTSEEAFSRAFKREFGIPPAHYRDRASDGDL